MIKKIVAMLAKYICDAKCQVFHSHDDVFLANQIITLIRKDIEGIENPYHYPQYTEKKAFKLARQTILDLFEDKGR